MEKKTEQVRCNGRAAMAANNPRTEDLSSTRIECSKVLIKTLNGETVPLTVSKSSTIGEAKAFLEEREDIPIAHQRLISAIIN